MTRELDRRLAAPQDRGRRELHVDRRAVDAKEPLHHRCRGVAHQLHLQDALRREPVEVGMQEVEHRAAEDHLRRLRAEQREGGAVHVHEASVGVHGRGLRRILDEPPVALLALDELGLRALALADVAGDGHPAGRVAGAARNGRHLERDPDLAPVADAEGRLEARRLARREPRTDVLRGGVLGVGVVRKELQPASDEALAPEAAEPTRGLVGPLHTPVGTADEDRLLGAARELREPLRNRGIEDRGDRRNGRQGHARGLRLAGVRGGTRVAPAQRRETPEREGRMTICRPCGPFRAVCRAASRVPVSAVTPR